MCTDVQLPLQYLLSESQVPNPALSLAETSVPPTFKTLVEAFSDQGLVTP